MSTDRRNLEVPIGAVDWGDLRRQEPVSKAWGFDRGQPIDRYYIENFLAQNAHHIHGHCLEIKDDNYTQKFGGDSVYRSEVLDIDPDNRNATIVGNLTDPQTLPPDSFDCLILTQTLPHIYDSRAAIKISYAALKPSGTLLITVPTIVSYAPEPNDYWRFTGEALTALIHEATDCEDWEVQTHGNLIASIGFLVGLASSELTIEELEYKDEKYPMVVTARMRKNR